MRISQILPQLVWGRGTKRSLVEGLASATPPHSVRSPSPSKLEEDS